MNAEEMLIRMNEEFNKASAEQTALMAQKTALETELTTITVEKAAADVALTAAQTEAASNAPPS